MKINKFDSNEIQVQKMLFNVQRYIDKPHFKDTIKIERLARDLYAVGQKCKETEKGNILTNCLTALAEKMRSAKQDNIAAIIYSFLIKFNADNPKLLKEFASKALDIAKEQKDSVHVAARAGEICQVYKTYDIHGASYLSCLHLRKKALNDVYTNYDTAGARYRTISRQINEKDIYLELLIKTKYDIANELIVTNKQAAKNELLSAYKDLNKLSDNYKKQNERTYNMLKKHASMQLTEISLCKNTSFNNISEKFSQIRKNIIEIAKEKAPIENSAFDECFASMYDEFKADSLDDKFLNKSLQIVEELEALGNFFLADRICNILTKKNQDNIRNLKTIILKQLELSEKNNDNFGIFHFCTIIQKLFKKDAQAVSVNSYLKSLQFDIKAVTNVIENYDNLLNKRKLKPKEDYIKQLIFAKVNSARLQRNTNPEYTRKTIREVEKLIDKLPIGYIAEHPEMESSVRFVRQNNY